MASLKQQLGDRSIRLPSQARQQSQDHITSLLEDSWALIDSNATTANFTSKRQLNVELPEMISIVRDVYICGGFIPGTGDQTSHQGPTHFHPPHRRGAVATQEL